MCHSSTLSFKRVVHLIEHSTVAQQSNSTLNKFSPPLYKFAHYMSCKSNPHKTCINYFKPPNAKQDKKTYK